MHRCHCSREACVGHKLRMLRSLRRSLRRGNRFVESAEVERDGEAGRTVVEARMARLEVVEDLSRSVTKRRPLVTALTEIPRFCSSKFPTLGCSAA
ncbi:hypothetical protein FHX72_000870 [Pseudoclavibacter helvolus]|uniref:Uncharacterized protein n=1 Tax=Pseudoclavibacter helvolus TaxID=255205 RepID=A0A7W4UM84_9MICO|nr:hypothetical protein [Pseudoclavibacter helvolus]